MTPARFIVLEGVEGSGKSTQIRLLGAWLAQVGVSHIATREPGGTRVGEAIRRILLDQDGLEMPAETELLLMLAASRHRTSMRAPGSRLDFRRHRSTMGADPFRETSHVEEPA